MARYPPAYYAFVSKKESILTFVIRVENTDTEFPPDMYQFLASIYDIKHITESEATTFEAMGLAPILPPKEIGAITIGPINDIQVVK